MNLNRSLLIILSVWIMSPSLAMSKTRYQSICSDSDALSNQGKEICKKHKKRLYNDHNISWSKPMKSKSPKLNRSISKNKPNKEAKEEVKSSKPLKEESQTLDRRLTNQKQIEPINKHPGYKGQRLAFKPYIPGAFSKKHTEDNNEN